MVHSRHLRLTDSARRGLSDMVEMGQYHPVPRYVESGAATRGGR
jgi:hypothetical protein